MQQDPYYQNGAPGYGTSTLGTMQKLMRELRLDYTLMPGDGAKQLGVNDVETSATFAVPFLYNTQTPLLVKPGFAFHLWNGPGSGPPPPDAQPADMPGHTFDAYLDTAWNPQVADMLSGELSFRMGVYSDFTTVTTRSIRFTGTGLAVLNLSPSIKVKAGIMYYDRNLVKLLPSGGVVWKPNSDVQFDILFPNPKFSKHMTTYGTTDWWWYLRGDYGGGAWTIRRADTATNAGSIDFVDYDDMRIALGLDFSKPNGVKGLLEAGVAFERQLRYSSQQPEVFYLNTGVFFRGSIAY
jgi:hypothetical protein